MGVFKWLRRERVTVTTSHISSRPTTPEEPEPPSHVGTIRTEEYKRDLAEFQARRSSGQRELQETPVKKKCGRHSLPVSCADCTGDPDTTFNYEKKSAIKYKKKTNKRARSAHSEEKATDGVPNVQFLFQNQVFMPGNLFPPTSFSEPRKTKRHPKQAARRSSEMDFLVQKHIDFKDDNELSSPPLFFKNNSLAFDVKSFLDGKRTDNDEVDGGKGTSDVKSSHSSSESPKESRSEEKLWEVMSELKKLDCWAEEQLHSPASKCADNKSETSTIGLPVASSSNLNVTTEYPTSTWNQGKWGLEPVQIKKLTGVSMEHVTKKQNTEIRILSKYRHPNILLLMGVFADVHDNVHIICERCVDTLYNILHVQGRILSVQTAVHYALDIASALQFLRMQNYIHTDLSSASVMITAHDTAKLSDLSPCAKLNTEPRRSKQYQLYLPEPQYVNVEDTRESNQADCEPLLSQRSSEAYITANAVAKDHKSYLNSKYYNWQAPELFEPNEGMVYPCSKSDVYSLCMILWESCNASIPWKDHDYEQLKASYTLWKTGLPLAADGTYPGSLLSLLRIGLALDRQQRPDIASMQQSLLHVKTNLDKIEYIIIPSRLSKQKSSFSSPTWDDVSPTDSDFQTPNPKIEHKAVIHKTRDSSTESEKDTKSDASPLYETIRKTNGVFGFAGKCFLSDEDQSDNQILIRYEHLQAKECSSACSTPITKLRTKVRDLETPGMLHRSDSTEYCSILSPDVRAGNVGFNDDSNKDQSSIERSTAKLSRSFTPKSYKPLHIKVPDFNLDSIKTLLKDQNSSERSSYSFNIKNYSLPTTPIARSNKLRKNAWLSGDLDAKGRSTEKLNDLCTMSKSEGNENTRTDSAKKADSDSNSCKEISEKREETERSPESIDTVRDSFSGLGRASPPQDYSSLETESAAPEGTSWSLKSSEIPRCRSSSFLYSDLVPTTKFKVEEDILAHVNVKPLVAIHERWIHEAKTKSIRSMSLPENNRPNQPPALKPASHCVDTLQKSYLQLSKPGSNTGGTFKPPLIASCSTDNGSHLDNFSQKREAASKNFNGSGRDSDRFSTWQKKSETRTLTEQCNCKEQKVDQSTDTKNIEEFIRDLIRKEFHHIMREINDDTSETTSMGQKSEDFLNRGVGNILESLKNGQEAHPSEKELKRDTLKSFSHVTINGNKTPLLHITFGSSRGNSLHVLDSCVSITMNDSREKMNQSMEETLTADDVQSNSLKRCQAFSAIQEARSTEDLYIDDELTTQMQENFGGRIKVFPLQGSQHELLCDRRDQCCLLQIRRENAGNTVYFRADSSDFGDTDTQDIDDIDGRDSRDTVVFKRSISLVEERIQRVFPRRGSNTTSPRKQDDVKSRPKSDIIIQNINKESRVMSNSSPSLFMTDDRGEEVEVNIENVMCYQDSSSDECLKCQVESDDFELLEREIERDIANCNLIPRACGCLEKISEENLSVLNEEAVERN